MATPLGLCTGHREMVFLSRKGLSCIQCELSVAHRNQLTPQHHSPFDITAVLEPLSTFLLEIYIAKLTMARYAIQTAHRIELLRTRMASLNVGTNSPSCTLLNSPEAEHGRGKATSGRQTISQCTWKEQGRNWYNFKNGKMKRVKR